MQKTPGNNTRVHRAVPSWLVATLLLLLAGAAAAALWWKCRFDPEISFLPADDRAEWIVFPVPVKAGAHVGASLDTTFFRREFALERLPERARLSVRAARRVELTVNGNPVVLPPSENWKSVLETEMAWALRAGSNQIKARVFNDKGPPALWLELKMDSGSIKTDASWNLEMTGVCCQDARPARLPKLPGEGNAIAGAETLADVPAQFYWLALASGLMASLAIFWTRWRDWVRQVTPARFAVIALGLAVLCWLGLFVNNGVRMPFTAGFDANAHLTYIEYVRNLRKLPLPTEGFQMFQAPLYYIASATLLGLAGAEAGSGTAALWLRLFTMLVGIAHFCVIFFSVRLLYPRRRDAQAVALIIAAFLPMQLYLSHYVTNETLAAFLTSCTVFLGLRLLQAERPGVLQYLATGAVLGAALLTKATALLVAFPLLLAVVLKNTRPVFRARSALCNLGVFFVGALILCGWHYGRIWREFGTPLLGNWDTAAGFNWWQDPGYHMAKDYFRFGATLTAPFFSGLNGFWDGIYSTLWGDGLCGGRDAQQEKYRERRPANKAPAHRTTTYHD